MPDIALANELFKTSEQPCERSLRGPEYDNHQYCHIHLPATGVGGNCIPVYPWFLIKEMARKEKLTMQVLENLKGAQR